MTELAVVGERIRRFRKRANMSQETLQKLVGYRSSGMISQIENGNRGMSFEQFQALAKALHIHPAVLLSDVELSDDSVALLCGLMEIIEEHGDRYRKVLDIMKLSDR